MSEKTSLFHFKYLFPIEMYVYGIGHFKQIKMGQLILKDFFVEIIIKCEGMDRWQVSLN